MFIVVEGIEGSGKSTLSEGLAQALSTEGHDVVRTREPGGTPISDAIRQLFLRSAFEMSPLTEGLLVNAARAQHVSALIRPSLVSKLTVICDRFTDSTMAYQGYGRGFDLDRLREICAIATDGVEPDLTFVLDVPFEVLRDRIIGRPDELTLFAVKTSDARPTKRLKDAATIDRIEKEDEAFHNRVRRGFLELAKSPKHHLLDGTMPREQLLKMALAKVHALVGAA
jgi:dTMP kinase